MAIATLEEYLREFSVEIGDRILTSYPALHAPGDPVSPILARYAPAKAVRRAGDRGRRRRKEAPGVRFRRNHR